MSADFDRDELAIPFRDPDQPLDVGTILENTGAQTAAHIPPEARKVAREVMLAALRDDDPPPTVGVLLDRLEDTPPAERRQLVNRAREAVGLENLDAIADRERWASMQSAIPPRRDADGRAFLVCSADGCAVMPVGLHGAPLAVAARRWWCEAHRHLAAAGDDLPPTPAQVTPSMRLISADEEEQAAREDERRRAEYARRDAAKAAELAQLERIRRRYVATAPVPPVAGVPQRRTDAGRR